MANTSLLSALNVPTVLPFPAVRCLQWTDDGQLCFMTKAAIYILTPQPGINLDAASAIKKFAIAPKAGAVDPALGWYHNLIDLEKLSPTKWPDYSQEWAAVSLGSLDVTVKAVCSSPTNISRSATCVLAVLTSNMDLSLWSPGKNILKGEWTNLQNYTQDSMSKIKLEQTSQVLEHQITSIVWTRNANFGVSPQPVVDSSLLIAGTRAGSLLMFRLSEGPSLELVEKIPIHEGCITQLSVTSWTSAQLNNSSATLAVATTDRIVLLVLNQTLSVAGTTLSLSRQYTIELTIGPLEELSATTPPAAGGIIWVEPENRAPILIFGTPGALHLWSPASLGFTTGDYWSGVRELRLVTQAHFGSSSLYPLSGVHYVSRQDLLIVSLLDGSFHVVHSLSREPSFSFPDDHSHPSTEAISSRAQSILRVCEPTASGSQDICRIGAMVGYDDSTVVWLHEVCRPSDFSYKHEAKHNCMLVTAQLLGEPDDDTLLQNLLRILVNSKVSDGASPHELLRAIYVRLEVPGVVDRLHSRLLEILTPETHNSHFMEPPEVYSGELSPQFRRSFRRSLQEHLFGWDVILSHRLRLAIADFIWKLYTDLDKQRQCGLVAQRLLDHILHHILRVSVQHLMAVCSILQENDVPFIYHLIVQSLLPRCPVDIVASVARLTETLNTFGIHISVESLTPTSLNETCPACRTNIPLQDVMSAQCEKGHHWNRCSVTSFILSTTSVRTCIGCTRKALLPPSASTNSLNTPSMGWVVEEMLEAGHRCPFCGNNYVTLV